VQAGTLHRNDILSVGDVAFGRVRAMKDWKNEFVDAAPPGMPVKILGFKIAPQVGDIAEVPEAGKELKKAKKQYTVEKKSVVSAAPKEEEKAAEKKYLNIVLKADVLGSLEAISGTLEKMNTPEVGVAVVSKGLGNVNETDVLAAQAAGGPVMGFNVLSTREADLLARDKKVEIKTYKIIYEMFDEIKKRLQAMLPAEVIRTHLGKLQVLALFRGDKTGQVIGGRVTEGKLAVGANAVLYRGDAPIGEGVLAQIQTGKTDVKEARQGQECGVRINCKTPIQVDDVLDVFSEEKKERKLVLSQ